MSIYFCPEFPLWSQIYVNMTIQTLRNRRNSLLMHYLNNCLCWMFFVELFFLYVTLDQFDADNANIDHSVK